MGIEGRRFLLRVGAQPLSGYASPHPPYGRIENADRIFEEGLEHTPLPEALLPFCSPQMRLHLRGRLAPGLDPGVSAKLTEGGEEKLLPTPDPLPISEGQGLRPMPGDLLFSVLCPPSSVT